MNKRIILLKMELNARLILNLNFFAWFRFRRTKAIESRPFHYGIRHFSRCSVAIGVRLSQLQCNRLHVTSSLRQAKTMNDSEEIAMDARAKWRDIEIRNDIEIGSLINCNILFTTPIDSQSLRSSAIRCDCSINFQFVCGRSTMRW